jgi:hypothetical protein
MDKPKPQVSLLGQMEMEVLEEGREWMRRRLEEKLHKLIEEQGAISPPQRNAAEECAAPKTEAAKRRRRHRS